MDLKEILSEPTLAPSVAWKAVSKAFGHDVELWEPDTFRLELHRRGIDPNEALMAKLMAAQTIKTTHTFAHDYDVLFAFSLCCDGVPAACDAHHHPTVEQLCWAIHEIDRIAEKPLSHDEGFDPDEIDPAVAVVLLEEGFAIPPLELDFCRDVLNRMSHADPLFRGEVTHAWEPYEHADPEALHSKLDGLPETPLNVQLHRLADVKRYVSEKERERERQHVRLGSD